MTFPFIPPALRPTCNGRCSHSPDALFCWYPHPSNLCRWCANNIHPHTTHACTASPQLPLTTLTTPHQPPLPPTILVLRLHFDSHMPAPPMVRYIDGCHLARDALTPLCSLDSAPHPYVFSRHSCHALLHILSTALHPASSTKGSCYLVHHAYLSIF